MSNATEYTPPKVWVWDQENGGKFASINRPIAGATHNKDLPVGRHPLQLYSLATPNGVKVTVMLEELLALGHVGDGLCVIGKVALPDPLHLQIQEEALHHSVIPTIALSAHAAHQAMRLQQRLVRSAGVLCEFN